MATVQLKNLFPGTAAPDTATIELPDTAAKGPVPETTPEYQFRDETLKFVLMWFLGAFRSKRGLWLHGPMGAGKSSLACEVAGRLQIPLWQVSCHEGMEGVDLLGTWGIKDGATVFIPGPLVLAMKLGQKVLVDEVDRLRPGAAIVFNAIAEGRPVTLPSGEVVSPRKGFGIVATANTKGLQEDDSFGLYTAANKLDASTGERFHFLAVGYPSEDQELAIAASVFPKIPEDFRKIMIKLATGVREQFENGQLTLPLSTRTLVEWGIMAEDMRSLGMPKPFEEALKVAFTARLTDEQKQVVEEMLQRLVKPSA